MVSYIEQFRNCYSANVNDIYHCQGLFQRAVLRTWNSEYVSVRVVFSMHAQFYEFSDNSDKLFLEQQTNSTAAASLIACMHSQFQ